VAAREAVDAGFRCIKLKVGIAGSESSEIDRIGAVRGGIGPDVRLRLDANEAWGVDESVRILRAVERFDLDLVEQPVDRRDLAGMARVRRAVGTPIAADEAAIGLAPAGEVIANGAADVLVIKPMLAGGWRAARRIVEEANRAGLGAFVTTTLDSGIGVAAAAHLAATLPSPLPPCGLATGPLLADDLIDSPLPIVQGAMRVSPRPGLGVDLAEDAIGRLLGPWHAVGE
jgi:o-succinylbenzoate synthase